MFDSSFSGSCLLSADIPSQGQADPSAQALLFGIHLLLRESFALPRSPWRGVGVLSSQPTTGYNHSGANHVTRWSQDRRVDSIMQVQEAVDFRGISLGKSGAVEGVLLALVVDGELPFPTNGSVIVKAVRAVPSSELQRVVRRLSDLPDFVKGPSAVRAFFVW